MEYLKYVQLNPRSLAEVGHTKYTNDIISVCTLVYPHRMCSPIKHSIRVHTYIIIGTCRVHSQLV